MSQLRQEGFSSILMISLGTSCQRRKRLANKDPVPSCEAFNFRISSTFCGQNPSNRVLEALMDMGSKGVSLVDVVDF